MARTRLNHSEKPYIALYTNESLRKVELLRLVTAKRKGEIAHFRRLFSVYFQNAETGKTIIVFGGKRFF